MAIDVRLGRPCRTPARPQVRVWAGGSPGSTRRTRTTLLPLTRKLKVLRRSRSMSFAELFHPSGAVPELLALVWGERREQGGGDQAGGVAGVEPSGRSVLRGGVHEAVRGGDQPMRGHVAA